MILNKVKEVAGAMVVVRWEPPLEGACPIVGYNVYYREDFSQTKESKWKLVNVNRTAASYTFHLECWKEYEIAVTSFNAAGESDINDSGIWKLRTGKGTNSVPEIS